MVEYTNYEGDAVLRKEGYLQDQAERQGLLPSHEDDTFTPPFFYGENACEEESGCHQGKMKEKSHAKNGGDGVKGAYNSLSTLTGSHPYYRQYADLIEY